MARVRIGDMSLKARNPKNETYFYPTDDEGNDTGEVVKENPFAEERYDPLYDDFSNKEIARGARALDINNINKDREISAIADYLNDRAGSSDEEGPGNYDFEYTLNDKGKKIFSSFDERQAFQDRKRNRVEKRLAEEERDADTDVIETVADDPFIQGNVDRVDEMFTEMRDPGGGYAQYLPSNSDFEQASSSNEYDDDPTKDLLNNYIDRIIQEKTQRFRS